MTTNSDLPIGTVDSGALIGHDAHVVSWAARLKWGAARVSRSTAHVQLAQLLTPNDLPGSGWRVLDERAWRTGASGADAAWASRAKDSGLLTAWRSFEQSPGQRWLWVQVTPLTTEADAREALHVVPDRLMGNLRSDVKLVDGSDVEPVEVVSSSIGWAHEQRTTSARGEGVALYSAFTVGSTLVALSASGLVDSWTWAGVGQVAQAQADRLTNK